MSEIVERLVEVLRKYPIRDHQHPESELDHLRLAEAARAVLAAMRQPTAGMLIWGTENKKSLERWKAMIDEALK